MPVQPQQQEYCLHSQGSNTHTTALLFALAPPPLSWQVSVAIRLAVGVTEGQAAAGTDHAVASWLSYPANIRNAIALSGVPDPIGPDALIKWMLRPEIWVSTVRSPGSYLHTHWWCCETLRSAGGAGADISIDAAVTLLRLSGAWAQFGLPKAFERPRCAAC